MRRRISNAKIWGGVFQAEEASYAMTLQENNLGIYEKHKGCKFS